MWPFVIQIGTVANICFRGSAMWDIFSVFRLCFDAQGASQKNSSDPENVVPFLFQYLDVISASGKIDPCEAEYIS